MNSSNVHPDFADVQQKSFLVLGPQKKLWLHVIQIIKDKKRTEPLPKALV